jgi:hypothetical protein
METGFVNQHWAVVLPLASARALARLRRKAELLVLVDEDRVWLRGSSLDAASRKELLSLPALERYFVGDDEQLTPWNRLTPQAQIPAGAWMKLRDWADLSLPPSGWPGERPKAARLSLVRDCRERPARALLCAWNTWGAYVTTSPLFRLAGLAYVANSDERVVIRGESLPPLRGQRLTEDEGILVPAGWSWSPNVGAGIVRGAFGLKANESALWLASDRWERVPADAWVSATRSAVRETAREVGRA